MPSQRNGYVVNGYFDHNATTPLFPEARAALLEALETSWRNPSSLYPKAAQVRQSLEAARETLAQLLGVDDAQRVVFTSGATEANNIVFRHIAATEPKRPVLVSEIEHPSVLQPATRLAGETLSLLPVDRSGRAQLEALSEALAKTPPALVSLMAANNETGTLQPWREASSLCRERGIAFHCDATQWIGKYAARELGQCDWISGSAHKFGGPKGVGFLVVPAETTSLQGAQAGGPQESGLRGGTENDPAIAAMLVALQQAEQRLDQAAAIEKERDAFEARIQAAMPELRFCGSDAPRLWNTSMFILPKHKNLKWLTRLGDLGFEVSTGSACSSGRGNPSHILQAMGFDYSEMGRSLRVSAGWDTQPADWEALGEALIATRDALESGNERKTISLGGPNPLA